MSETLPTGEHDDGLEDAVDSIKATHEDASPRGIDLDSADTSSETTTSSSTSSSTGDDDDDTWTTRDNTDD